ncbi:SURF1 family cytochrome oxidase biogenesis protein [Lacisediminihabitans sp.]|uniref:SURF1 family cytochrome oxidase biogenesis protein n=1 Tax=Lacisediminihabitans sp. TaxID=2787631 RepID=UPI00374D7FD0
MWSVARRPRWIAALVFALALAAGFAALGQWQLARSVATGTVIERDTETIVPLTSVAKPQSPVTDRATAQLVTATGAWVPGDYVIVSDRLNKGVAGYWVVGHFSVDRPGDGGPVGLVAAVGWSATLKGAKAALSTIDASQASATVTVTGRYIPSESPQDSDFERGKLTTVSPGAMINLWRQADPAGVYGGYLISAVPAVGLTAIDSPKPSSDVEVNLLNVFYAVEWVVFAGFAIFLWYRLVKDAWEREQEEASEVN